MLEIFIILFWVSLAVLFYCYLGYGLLVGIINAIKAVFKKKKNYSVDLPDITLVVTAYNEQQILPRKIANTLSIDYPANKLQVIFVTDGSADGSQQLIAAHPSITLLHEAERKGKYAAIKRAMQHVKTPVVVFSDANTMLNAGCLKMIGRHYANPRIGGVAGEKKIETPETSTSIGNSEGLYWRYESLLKKIDADFNTVTGAAGELFSIRTNLFIALDDELILDDFIISMQICLQGYTIAYEPAAFATELPSTTLGEEQKRKVRISAGAYQSIGYLKASLNIFKHPLLSFQFISRRLLRWIFCPPLLVLLFISNVLIVFDKSVLFYQWTMIGQLLFYILAIIGGWLMLKEKSIGWLMVPFYFVFMNYCLVKGFFTFLMKKHTVLWEKAERSQS